jgi:hypothetical protein
MLVDVKTETTTNTPWDTTLVPCSVLHVLNRVQRLSALQKKTCFNSSKGGRIQLPTPIVVDTHYLAQQGAELVSIRQNLDALWFSPKGISFPPRPKGRGFQEIL